MSIKQRALKRSRVLAVLLALALPAFAASTASATPTEEAADWLVSELKPTPTSEPAYCESFSAAATVGQTIDCMLAFEAAGAAYDDERDATYEWIVANLDDYVGEESCEEMPASLSAGAVAKLSLAILSQGDDPRSTGGRNLIEDLECLQEAEGAETGRFADAGAFDFSNTFGQSLAIVSLKACEADCPGEPNLTAPIEAGASYLLGQQCAESEPATLDGAFRSPLGLSPEECSEGPPFPEEGGPNLDAVDVDSTGVAVLGLLAEGGAESESAAEAARLWLQAQEQSSGAPPLSHWESYCDFFASETLFPSVNSTAAAIGAYAEEGIPIGPAQAWLEEAVEENPEGEGGMPACGTTGPPDVLATAQGVLGLTGTSYLQLAGL